MAEITLKDVDVAQFYDAFTMFLLSGLEAYGVVGRGEAGPFVAEGLVFRLPVKCGCPYLVGSGPQALASAGPAWVPPEIGKDLSSRVTRGPAFETALARDSACCESRSGMPGPLSAVVAADIDAAIIAEN